MDFSLLVQYVNIVFREVWLRKFWCLFGFTVVSFAVLVVGMFWPSKFQTSATIFADNQNILKPLLENQAAQTELQDQVKVVRDMIQSPRILRRVVENLYGVNSFESHKEIGQKVNSLMGAVDVTGLGARASYIKVSYSDTTPDQAYRVINEIVDVFIKTSSEKQREESREAFLFIDNQVNQYKDQLVLAEERLKEFRSLNLDGSDRDVDASIGRLRDQIEELKISIDEDKTAIASIEKQLEKEPQYSANRVGVDVYSERLSELESRKSTLLLSYTEDYPDIVSLNYQIDDIKQAMREADENEDTGRSDGSEESAVLNPLYQELRSRLSLVKTEIEAKEKRQIALGRLMEQEFDRRVRIAGRGAEESELNRDYDVTRRIYEDMLERKEKARLSMTLNIEGQGVTYRVEEPALPPLNPVGLRYLHFVILGPFVGLLFVIGLVVVFIMLDQRIRFPDRLQGLGVATLAVVPHIKTPLTERVVKVDLIICFLLSSFIMAAYIGLAYASKMGVV